MSKQNSKDPKVTPPDHKSSKPGTGRSAAKKVAPSKRGHQEKLGINRPPTRGKK